MGASSGPRLSGMQKQVLHLYRGFLRVARTKSLEDRRQIESVVSAEFRRNSKQVDRKNFLYIEYLIRRGNKQLDQLKSPDTVGLSSEEEVWLGALIARRSNTDCSCLPSVNDLLSALSMVQVRNGFWYDDLEYAFLEDYLFYSSPAKKIRSWNAWAIFLWC